MKYYTLLLSVYIENHPTTASSDFDYLLSKNYSDNHYCKIIKIDMLITPYPTIIVFATSLLSGMSVHPLILIRFFTAGQNRILIFISLKFDN